PLRPVTALVYVTSPVRTPVNFTISNLGSSNTASMQALIKEVLADMFLRLANVGGSIDPSTMSGFTEIDPNSWYEALGAIPGLTQFNVSAPTTPLSPGKGELFVLGNVTFQS
ncbi:hypothetical protein FGG78_44730, partial [Thioclava sp. BHET1]